MPWNIESLLTCKYRSCIVLCGRWIWLNIHLKAHLYFLLPFEISDSIIVISRSLLQHSELVDHTQSGRYQGVQNVCRWNLPRQFVLGGAVVRQMICRNHDKKNLSECSRGVGQSICQSIEGGDIILTRVCTHSLMNVKLPYNLCGISTFTGDWPRNAMPHYSPIVTLVCRKGI